MTEKDKIKTARFQVGQFFKARREEMGRTAGELAEHLGISENTIRGIETGRFAWDIDLHFRIRAALEIKPYFSVASPPWEEDGTLRTEDDPERYHGYYIVENLLLWPEQIGILKLTYPRLFVRFNYGSYFLNYEDWKANHTVMEWLDPDDKPVDAGEVDFCLTECWNFLALHEQEEERLAGEDPEFSEEF